MKAAESIEKAAKRLEDIKKKKNSEQVSMEDMAFDDLILESVQSVTKSATSLINAATVAQKVLVAQGKMSKNAKKGKEDSQWSQGLVSAAQVVASVIGSLCEAANTVIQEGTDGNVLAATAKQVSKSTIQLVLACQVKA